MPGFGFPKTLELTLNDVLQDSNVASYKIAGNSSWIIIVLKFDASIAGASESKIHQ